MLSLGGGSVSGGFAELVQKEESMKKYAALRYI